MPRDDSGMGGDVQSLADMTGDFDDTNELNHALPLSIATSGTSAPDIVATEFRDLQPLDTVTALEWRIEVTNNGKNWNWRRGSGDQRVGRYGGIFGLLSEERQAQYERNKITHGRTKTAAKTTAATGKKRRTLNSQNGNRRVSTVGYRRGTRTKSGRITPTA